MPNDLGSILFSTVDQQWDDENLLERIWNHPAPFVCILIPLFMLTMIFWLAFVLSVEAKDNNKRKFLHELVDLPMEQRDQTFD